MLMPKEWVKKYLRAKYKVFSVRVRKEKLERFRLLCKQNHISQSSVVNDAITNFIKEYENEA